MRIRALAFALAIPAVPAAIVTACSASAPLPAAPKPSPSSSASALTIAAPKPHARVAITFDDLPAHGPLPEGTTRVGIVESIAKTLAAHHVPPTYGFTNGGKLKDHPEDAEVLRTWVRAGNLLGNHGLTHMALDDETNVAAYLKDLDDDEETLRTYSPAGTPERSWKVYRYPQLQEGTTPAAYAAVRAHLKDRGYRIAEVSIDFGDWAWNSPYARCTEKHDARAIAALDESYVQEAKTFLKWADAAAWQAFHHDVPQVLLLHVGAEDARALDAMLTAYENAGVTFVGLDEALDDPAYAIETKYYGVWGEGFFEQLADGLGTVTMPTARMPLALLEGLCRG